MATAASRRLLGAFLLVLIAVVLAGEDYYKILGIGRQADDDDIKKAFRKMAIKYHPDKNKDPGAQDKFAKISHAYEILSDKEKRQVYDMYGEEGLSGNVGGGGGGGGQRFGGGRTHYEFRDPSEIFRQFFGQHGAGFGGAQFTTYGNGGFRGQSSGFGGSGFGDFGGGGHGFGGGGGHGFGGGGHGYRQAPEPVFDSNSNVFQLTASNWDQKIRKDKDVALIMFYTSRSDQSHVLKTAFEKVAAEIKGTAVVGAVNCDEEHNLCRRHGASDLPSIKLFGYRMHDRPESIDDKKAKPLFRKISDAIPSFVTKLDQQTWFVFKRQEEQRPIVVFLTKKPDHLSNLIRALSTEFHGDAVFGQGDVHDSIFSSEFKMLPKNSDSKLIFRAVDPTGELKSFLYKGKLEFKPMKKFVAKLLKKYAKKEKPSMSNSGQTGKFTSKASLRQSGINVILCLNSANDYKKWSAILDQLANKYKTDAVQILWGTLLAPDLQQFGLKSDTWLIWSAKKDKFTKTVASTGQAFSEISAWIDRALGGDLRLTPISDANLRDEL